MRVGGEPVAERVLRVGWRVERDYPYLSRVRLTLTVAGRIAAEVRYVLLTPVWWRPPRD